MPKDGDPIPEEDHVARWCLGTRSVSKGSILPGAFEPREGEEYLSGNWLEFHCTDPVKAVNLIRSNTSLNIRDSDKLIVLLVQEILDAIEAGGGHSPAVRFAPAPDNESHVAIEWDNWGDLDQEIATELLTRVTPEKTYEPIPD